MYWPQGYKSRGLFTMDPKEKPKYEKISDLAGPDQKKHGRIKREAQRSGAYARFNDEDYVDQEAVLAFKMESQKKARKVRDEKKASHKKSSNRYAHIGSLKKINVIINKISEPIQGRTEKMDAILEQIESETDQDKRGNLSEEWDILSSADQKGTARLTEALSRRKEIEVEKQKKIDAALKARSRSKSSEHSTEIGENSSR